MIYDRLVTILMMYIRMGHGDMKAKWKRGQELLNKIF